MVPEADRLRAALDRTDALVGLATWPGPLDDVLRRAVEVLTQALPGSAAGVWVIGADGATMALRAGTGPDLAERALPVADVVADGTAELVTRDAEGRVVALLWVGQESIDDADLVFAGRLAEVVGACVVRGRREEALARSERRLIEAQRISHVGSYDFEIVANTNIWSDQLYRIYGREPQSFDATYESFMELVHPDDREHVAAVHQRSLETLRPFEMEERVVWPDGQVRTLASWGEVVADAEGRPQRMVGICWDITDRLAVEEQLVHEALHDRLTGLPNRALFLDRLAHALPALQRRAGVLAVLFIDVDRFKVINDSLGHEAGDEVLRELARRLGAMMRPGDSVARFGGDEFVVLCEGLDDPGQAVAIADRLQAGISVPLAVRGAELVVTVSTGIAVSAACGDSPGALLRDADAAMYRAKQQGRARSVIFADAMRAEAKGRLDTETELRHALSHGQLRVYYQPIMDMQSGWMVAVEALVRWQHPTRGLVPPEEFIGVAEETGLIVPLGEWVLEESCNQLLRWRRDHPHHARLGMAVNVSGVQIAQLDFVDRVTAVLSRTGLEGSGLELEITESVLMRDAEQAMSVLRALRALGVRLSIDDFGTGYSSLSYLRRFPVDTLKIDRSFVDGLGHDPEDAAIVQTIVSLATSLGMATVAEGVETALQYDLARSLGCIRSQGFFMSRPLPAAELARLLAELPAGSEVPLPRAPMTVAARSDS